MMNFPGVIAGDASVLKKLALFQDGVIDGHCPGLSGTDLQAYLCAGIRSDHEAFSLEEAREKVRMGMMVMIREGTSARNLDALIPLVNERNQRRFCFVSDDLHPQDILGRGHLNHMVQRAVAGGLDPAIAFCLATLNPCRYFRLFDRGALAPGYCADFVLWKDLESFQAEKVYKSGHLVAENGSPVGYPEQEDAELRSRPLAVGTLSPERFSIQSRGSEARIIDLVPGQILTRQSREKVPADGKGILVSDTDRDILRLAVVERHRGTGRIGLGLVRGFQLKRGGFATSVAHDSHNIISVGVFEKDLCQAVGKVAEMGGGMAVTDGDRIVASVPLPIAGLMSRESLKRLDEQLESLQQAIQLLGCPLQDPFMILSFLALPVIPELKLTDQGLVDTTLFDHVPLFFNS
jgi:adenine deaminase